MSTPVNDNNLPNANGEEDAEEVAEMGGQEDHTQAGSFDSQASRSTFSKEGVADYKAQIRNARGKNDSQAREDLLDFMDMVVDGLVAKPDGPSFFEQLRKEADTLDAEVKAGRDRSLEEYGPEEIKNLEDIKTLLSDLSEGRALSIPPETEASLQPSQGSSA